ncbi:DUF5132 domain-containing protein [Nitrosococcus wardiae]|uniref:DUF5132 domain-containing protein n=1 Tax=Nitrosococcus wardiae TaxID=1814290 RepID=A0A4P7C2Y7_9GAMM|nr:DUF5132 domain-containing protein [Nitrosococcus wardiae]QBQ55904.1 DUF5132 domain-containing protein [Nitrosococcus wardiae]
MASLSGTGKGLEIGIGTLILAPAVAAVVRPVAKAAIKAGMVVYERGREAVTEMGEVVEDLVAEAKTELEEERSMVVGEAAEAEEESTSGKETPLESNSQ